MDELLVTYELRKQLNVENRAFYEEFESYLLRKNFLTEDDSVASMLADLLQDLILAQQEGLSAREYFGVNPQEIADDMLKNVEPATVKSAFYKLKFMMMNGYFLILLLLSRENEVIGIFEGVIFFAVPTLLGVGIFGAIIFDKEYSSSKLKKKLKITMLAIVMATLVVGSGVIIGMELIPNSGIVVASEIRLLLIPVVFLWVVAVMAKKKDKKERILSIPMLVMSLGFGIQGLLVHSILKGEMSRELFLGMNLNVIMNLASMILFAITFVFVMKIVVKKEGFENGEV